MPSSRGHSVTSFVCCDTARPTARRRSNELSFWVSTRSEERRVGKECRSGWGHDFFQAEDGIRDDLVTGVQTCALPILCRARRGLCCALFFLDSLCSVPLFRVCLPHVAIPSPLSFAATPQGLRQGADQTSCHFGFR